jgi:hypothetical protein
VARHRPVLIAVAAIVLLILWAFLHQLYESDDSQAWLEARRNGGSQTTDTIKTLIIALGPATVSVSITLLAGSIARRRFVKRVFGFGALGLILVQAAWLFGAQMVFGGGLVWNWFVAVGVVGLVVSGGAWAVSFVRGAKRRRGDEGDDWA